MIREERAREAYAQAVEQLGGPARMSIAADIRADTSTEYYHVTMAAMLAFADAEIERAAQVTDDYAEKANTFRETSSAVSDESGEWYWSGRRIAGQELATAIRDLKGQP